MDAYQLFVPNKLDGAIQSNDLTTNIYLDAPQKNWVHPANAYSLHG